MPAPPAFKKARGGDRGIETARARGKPTTSAALAAQVDVNKPLTDQQKQFVRAWAQGDSLSAAAKRAGYADDKFVYRMVRMPNILALKAKYEAQWQEENQMTRKKVMDGMLESIEMAKLMAEPATMIQGWKTIGQLCGYFAPVEHKMKVDVTGNIIIDKMNSLSDAELLKIISGGVKSADLLGLEE